jgi:hypothetical protein
MPLAQKNSSDSSSMKVGFWDLRGLPRRWKQGPRSRPLRNHRQLPSLAGRRPQSRRPEPSELPNLKGSDPRKLLLAHLLSRRTTVSQQWLAQNLAMKSAADVSQQFRRLDLKKTRAQAPRALRSFLDQSHFTS